MRYVKFIVAFCVLFIFIPVAPAKDQRESDMVEKDGIYLLYADGIVRDTKTGLEWVAGPDKDMNWNEAKDWVESLRLDGRRWRMPTMDELESLYRKGVGSHNMTPLLRGTSNRKGVGSHKLAPFATSKMALRVWSSRHEENGWHAESFNFIRGYRLPAYKGTSRNLRAFAVRSRGDG